MKKKTVLLALLLSFVLVFGLLPVSAMAGEAEVVQTEESPEITAEDEVEEIEEKAVKEDIAGKEEQPEAGPVTNVEGNTLFNSAEGVVYNDGGIVYNNGGIVFNNSGTVYNNDGTVYNNAGTVYSNLGTVYNNGGIVYNNGGTVIEKGPVEEVADEELTEENVEEAVAEEKTADVIIEEETAGESVAELPEEEPVTGELSSETVGEEISEEAELAELGIKLTVPEFGPYTEGYLLPAPKSIEIINEGDETFEIENVLLEGENAECFTLNRTAGYRIKAGESSGNFWYIYPNAGLEEGEYKAVLHIVINDELSFEREISFMVKAKTI